MLSPVCPGVGDIAKHTHFTPNTYTLTFFCADTHFQAHKKKLALYGTHQKVSCSGMN